MASSDDEGYGELVSWKHRLRVLVVDSCYNSRLFQTLHLTAFGAETDSVATGDSAAELIYGGKMYDLIVVDRVLSDATGIQITRQLRYMDVDSKIAVVSSMYSEREKIAFMEAGADYYIEKKYRFQNKFISILAEIDDEP